MCASMQEPPQGATSFKLQGILNQLSALFAVAIEQVCSITLRYYSLVQVQKYLKQQVLPVDVIVLNIELMKGRLYWSYLNNPFQESILLS